MAEQAVQQPIIVQPAETGRNWEARKKWETSLPGITITAGKSISFLIKFLTIS